MYQGIYRMAEMNIRVVSLHEDVHRLCREYVWDGEPDLTVEITVADVENERRRSAATDVAEGRAVIDYPDGYLETLAVYRRIADRMLMEDTLLFHGSAVAVDGVAYLFTAASGTGKSTHTRLWRAQFEERAVMINDDKPLIRLDGARATVYGTPWQGKHGLGKNTHAPLRAICILERAADNHIRPVTKREVYAMLLQQTYRPSDPVAMGRMLGLVDRLAAAVKLYCLGCNMDPDAARVAYEGMCQRIEEE